MILTRDGIAWRIACDLDEGSYVNLGVGIPVLVSNYLDPGKEIFLHSENGILGVGPSPKREEIDLDLLQGLEAGLVLPMGDAVGVGSHWIVPAVGGSSPEGRDGGLDGAQSLRVAVT